MAVSLTVLNLNEATFECSFGRGCAGLCCQNGRPGLYDDEVEILEANLDKILPHLRPEARELVAAEGFLSRRQRYGRPMLRVIKHWCVFFNQGCVLHKLGAQEGDKFRYKPIICALFPLNRADEGGWYVRQWGYQKEPWDLFCLNPQNSQTPASQSMQEEMELARKCDEEVNSSTPMVFEECTSES